MPYIVLLVAKASSVSTHGVCLSDSVWVLGVPQVLCGFDFLQGCLACEGWYDACHDYYLNGLEVWIQ